MSRYAAENYRAWDAEAESSARVVVPLMIDLVEPHSVIDVGCGTGAWLAVFREAGVDEVLGVDGDSVEVAMLRIPEELFVARDLSRPFSLDRHFDLVVSLEVAEHLPAESADGYVESLTALGPVVLFSAAIPGQDGVHHVNEQWPEYWAERFAARGYVPVDCLRRRIWSNEAVAWWYAQNSLVFVEREHLSRTPRLKAEHEAAGTSQLRLVHPVKYELLRDWTIEKARRQG
jgi:SAM-dependent methyltransferase